MLTSPLVPSFALLLSMLTSASASYGYNGYGVQPGYGGSGGFVGGYGGCSNNYNGGYYGGHYKRTFGNDGLCCRIFGCFCNNGYNAQPAPVYVCLQNYPYSYPVQGGIPPYGWSGSGCGCDGYAVDWRGAGVPAGLPVDFQFYGTKGWTAPQHWKAPSRSFKPNAATQKALATSHWYNPAHAMDVQDGTPQATLPKAYKAPTSFQGKPPAGIPAMGSSPASGNLTAVDPSMSPDAMGVSPAADQMPSPDAASMSPDAASPDAQSSGVAPDSSTTDPTMMDPNATPASDPSADQATPASDASPSDQAVPAAMPDPAAAPATPAGAPTNDDIAAAAGVDASSLPASGASDAGSAVDGVGSFPATDAAPAAQQPDSAAAVRARRHLAN
ncbi:hypothetical protein RQP46_005622 [Phenoliferia psychrophenolica]